MSKKKLLNDFIQEAELLHGDKYDYSQVEYKTSKDKVKINCKIHGTFKQTPNNHLRGKGCKFCGDIKKAKNRIEINQLKFILDFQSSHGNRYDYSKFRYTKSRDKSTIICKIHGEFEQSHNIHKKGVGCPTCGTELAKSKISKTTEHFIKKATDKFGDKFSYVKSEYKCRFCEIEIECATHGSFTTLVSNHLSSKYGCEKCSREAMGENAHGWSYGDWENSATRSKNFDSFKLYIIRCWNEDEEFYKVGKTFTKIELRYGRKKEMPYNFEICKLLISKDARYICKTEESIKRDNKDNKYVPKNSFGGKYECFTKIN